MSSKMIVNDDDQTANVVEADLSSVINRFASSCSSNEEKRKQLKKAVVRATRYGPNSGKVSAVEEDDISSDRPISPF